MTETLFPLLEPDHPAFVREGRYETKTVTRHGVAIPLADLIDLLNGSGVYAGPDVPRRLDPHAGQVRLRYDSREPDDVPLLIFEWEERG